MSKVAIVTDTVNCLPQDLISLYDIRVLPVGLIIDLKIYPDDQMSNEEFWKKFYQTKEPITTSATTPAEFEKAFTEAAKDHDGVCCILVSKELSSIYRNAAMAVNIMKEEHPDTRIEIIDSKTASGAEGFVVLEAAKAAKEGRTLDEVVKATRDMVERVKWVGVLQTLKYIIRSGRAPKAAMIGNWLGVKPLIGGVTGTGLVESLGKVRGAEKSVTKLIDMVGEYIDREKPVHVMVHYTDDMEAGEKLKKRVEAKYICEEIFLTPYSPVMASQTGPELAIAFYQ